MSDIMNVCFSGHWPSHLERFSLVDQYQVLFDPKSQKILIQKLWFPSNKENNLEKWEALYFEKALGKE